MVLGRLVRENTSTRTGAARFGALRRYLASPRGMRWRARVGTAVDLFPWTPLGLALGGAAYAALRIFAYAQLDLVWLVTGYAVLGLCALAPLFVVPAALWLRFRLRRHGAAPSDALLLETQLAAATGFSLPALRFAPFVQIRWHWLSPKDARVRTSLVRGHLREAVELPERGQHQSVLRRVIVEDPFGLARVALRVPEERSVRVLPRLLGLRHLPQLASLAAGTELPHPQGMTDGDRLELQRYTAGDPARFIHWKVLARTGKLMVRKPERAVSLSRRSAAFYIAADDDDASAAVARLALENRLLGNDWVFGTDLAPAGVSRVDEALQKLIESVAAREHAGANLAAFVAQVDKRGPASLIIFAPIVPGRWLDAVAQVARSRQVRVVLGVDSVQTTARPPFWLRLLTTVPPLRAASAEALEAVVTTLARAGVAVTILDRASGQALGPSLRRAMQRLHKGLSRGATSGRAEARP